MRVSTAFNHRERYLRRVVDIYGSARSFGAPHKWILGQLKKHIHNDDAWSRVPSWVQSSVNERGHQLLKDLYRPYLHEKELMRLLEQGPDAFASVRFVRWQHRLDGVFVTSDEVCAKRAAGDENVWDRLESAHIWNHNHKPFSPWAGASEPHVVVENP